MQAYFKLSNDILNIGLTPNELKVATYLYSCVRKGNPCVSVKQRVIASKCGISKVETVGGIICRLQRKGVIERVSRPHKTNGQLGTYIYKLKEIASKGFFKVKRYILGKLTGVQLRMYLFVCRAVTKKNDMWNSFNDIADALQIARKKVIAVINELVGLGFIRKLRVLKKDGSFSDNHYSVYDMLKSGDTLVVGSLYCLGENTAEIIRNMEFFMYCNVRLDILDLPVTFSEGECLNGRPEKTYLLLYRSQSYSFGRKRNYPPFTQISR